MEGKLVTKVFLDTHEYERLLAIEEKYNALLKHQSQKGEGVEKTCTCQQKNMPLSQIVATNQQRSQITQEIPKILPDITNPYEAEMSDSGTSAGIAKIVGESGKKVRPWYYLGDLPNARK